MTTPEQRSMRARIGAYSMHAKHDPKVTTQAGRDVFMNRFDREVDPNCVLSLEVRLRRAKSARKAHMTRLALASSKARAKQRTHNH